LWLIDRRFSSQFPTQPDYIGKSNAIIVSQKVKIFWKTKNNKDKACLVND